MKLQSPKYKDGIRTVLQRQFGGIDRRVGAADGCIVDMLNMTSEHSPVLSTRNKRANYADYQKIMSHFGIASADSTARLLCVCDVADQPYYVVVCVDEPQGAYLQAATVEAGASVLTADIPISYHPADDIYDTSQFDGNVCAVAFNNGMVVFSIGACVYISYDKTQKALSCERIDYSWDGWNKEQAMSWHEDGRTYLQLKASALACEPLIREQDVLHLTRHPQYVEGEREQTYYLTVLGKRRVSDVAGDECVLLECSYTPGLYETRDPDDPLLYDPDTSYTMFAFEHSVPQLEHVCVCRDRIWGTSGNEIYCCASEDPRNWYKFDGTAADSFYARISEVSRFTGIASYAGSVYFFTRENVYRMYGTTPDTFKLVALGTYGLEQSEAKSFGVASGALFYNSTHGPVLFDSGSARLIGRELGGSLPSGVRGVGFGSRYYMCSGSEIYVYDITCGCWHRWTSAMNIFDIGVFAGRVILFERLCAEYVDRRQDEQASGFDQIRMTSCVEFADITEGGIYGVCPIEFVLDMWLGDDSEMTLCVSCDGGEWEQAYKSSESGRHIHRVRFLPKTRCDSYRLRLEGVGEWRLHSLARSYSVAAGTPCGS